ncbi:DUF2867 domain-containing protein [Streptomyces triticagri]|uniref:DUF2867 domain-containing protein n=1 Tax=Streptomyces triticagri TaxID=2293568 RepID=A0A372MCC3_9ACTN|nr:DUF2867 domain-containing protein [Streptomyces triticagri]RFU88165.1 DUF2867 domain-containing protein [Streptomyces triticagri]
MRLPRTAFTSRPWRVHEIADDFRVEDVWALPTPGGPDDLARLVAQFTERDDDRVDSVVYRALFAVRWKLGRLFRLDRPKSGVGARVATLRDRLPDDLRAGERGPDIEEPAKFHSVFLTHDEWAAEMANSTMHCVLHLGWVSDGSGGYHGVMTVLVKPNGLLGRLYMLGIKPFRYVGVYPALLRSIGRRWRLNARRDAVG